MEFHNSLINRNGSEYLTKSKKGDHMQEDVDYLPHGLTGYPIDIKFRIYSGYVIVYGRAGIVLFYSFIEAIRYTIKQTLVLCLNGGKWRSIIFNIFFVFLPILILLPSFRHPHKTLQDQDVCHLYMEKWWN